MANQSSDPCSHELTFKPGCKASQPAFQSPFSHFGHTDTEFSNHMILQMSPVNWRFSVAKGHFLTLVLSFPPLKLDFPNPGSYNHLNISLHLKGNHTKNCLLHTSKHLLSHTPSHTANAHLPAAQVQSQACSTSSSTSSAYQGTSLTSVPVASVLWVSGRVSPSPHLASTPSHSSDHTPRTATRDTHRWDEWPEVLPATVKRLFKWINLKKTKTKQTKPTNNHNKAQNQNKNPPKPSPPAPLQEPIPQWALFSVLFV